GVGDAGSLQPLGQQLLVLDQIDRQEREAGAARDPEMQRLRAGCAGQRQQQRGDRQQAHAVLPLVTPCQRTKPARRGSARVISGNTPIRTSTIISSARNGSTASDTRSSETRAIGATTNSTRPIGGCSTPSSRPSIRNTPNCTGCMARPCTQIGY